MRDAPILKIFRIRLRSWRAMNPTDLVDRTKSHMWKFMRDDGKKEGFDPGDLDYDSDLT